jgi:DNA-binding transcriptional ArsR family regulator
LNDQLISTENAMVPKQQGGGESAGGRGKQDEAKRGRVRKATKAKARAKGKPKRGKATHTARELAAGLIDPHLAVVIKDPLRVQILAIAIQRPLSPSEFAKESGCSLSASAYHFKVLKDHGFIELVENVPVRGTYRHMYRATKSGFISNNDWGQVAQAFRPGVAGAILQDFNNRVTQAMETETLYSRDDACLYWAPLNLDEIGWSRLTEMIAWAIEEAKEYEVETVNRRNKGENDDCISVTFAIAGFESPKERERKKGRKRDPAKGTQSPGKGKQKPTIKPAKPARTGK